MQDNTTNTANTEATMTSEPTAKQFVNVGDNVYALDKLVEQYQDTLNQIVNQITQIELGDADIRRVVDRLIHAKQTELGEAIYYSMTRDGGMINAIADRLLAIMQRQSYSIFESKIIAQIQLQVKSYMDEHLPKFLDDRLYADNYDSLRHLINLRNAIYALIRPSTEQQIVEEVDRTRRIVEESTDQRLAAVMSAHIEARHSHPVTDAPASAEEHH